MTQSWEVTFGGSYDITLMVLAAKRATNFPPMANSFYVDATPLLLRRKNQTGWYVRHAYMC